MDIIKVIWPIVSGGLVVPLAAWIKGKLPADLPIQSFFITALLNAGLVIGLGSLLAPGIPMNDLLVMALGSQAMSQATHSLKKSTGA